jgi:hypothetical protein
MKSREVSIAAFLLIAIVACSGTPASTTNTSASSPPPETTAPPETTGGPTTSEDVAVAFFEAWLSDDQDTMIGLAEPDAVAQANDLMRLATATWEFSLCEGAAGTVFCTWTSEEPDNLVVGVRNIEEPHIVTSFRVMSAS